MQVLITQKIYSFVIDCISLNADTDNIVELYFCYRPHFPQMQVLITQKNYSFVIDYISLNADTDNIVEL